MTVVCDMKGMLSGGGWFEAKEMWDGGWKSLVAIRVTKVGVARRVLITGIIVRPLVTAREPF